MVGIVPFNGYRYKLEKVKTAATVVAPPYDVINQQLKQELFNRSPFNVAHITKGYDDSTPETPYQKAAGLFEQWCSDGILEKDPHPAIYVYEQQFSIKEQDWSRTGFIALLELEEFCMGQTKADIRHPHGNASSLREDRDQHTKWGEADLSSAVCCGVHQHEETLPKDIADRLNLLRATHANYGQIFSIYDDADGAIDAILNKTRTARKSVMEAKDDDGVVHRLWAMTDAQQIEQVIKIMAGKSVIIADGHHRYKTALAFRDESPEIASAKYRMMTFVNMANEGLVVLPTHRLINNIENFDTEQFLEALLSTFNIVTLVFKTEEEEKKARGQMFERMQKGFEEGKHVFGFYCKTGAYYILTLKGSDVPHPIDEHSEEWQQLDVTILHNLILDRMLHIDRSKLLKGSFGGGAYVEYIKDIGNAIQESLDKVNHHGYQAIFFMNPTKISEVQAVSMNHETMPQKSTFFYPKVYTGFVINKL